MASKNRKQELAKPTSLKEAVVGTDNVLCPQCSHARYADTRLCASCNRPWRPEKPLAPRLWLAALMLPVATLGFWLGKGIPALPEQVSAAGIAPLLVSGPRVRLYPALATVENVPAGNFRYGGSTAFAPLRDPSIVRTFGRAHPTFQVRYTEPPGGEDPGSGTGIAMLLDGQLDLAQSARPVNAAETARARAVGIRLEQVPVAIDGVAFYTHPQVKLKGLSVVQLRGIFSGAITNWKEVGGTNQSIVPFSLNPASADFIDRTVMEGRPLGRQVRIVRDVTTSLRRVATTEGAIGYASAAQVLKQRRQVRTLALARGQTETYVEPFDPQAPTQVNRNAFRIGAYPLTQLLFVVIRRDSTPAEQAGVAYVNLLLSEEGQRLVETAGFVAMR